MNTDLFVVTMLDLGLQKDIQLSNGYILVHS